MIIWRWDDSEKSVNNIISKPKKKKLTISLDLFYLQKINELINV